jgi:hypothetical protein
MTGNLDEAIAALLKDALPALLGGAQPPVTLSVQSETFATDPNAGDSLASEPRPDDFSDQFAFNPAGIVFDPQDPAYDPAALPRFTLSKPPYPGPRRVRLVTGAGDRITLGEREVTWDEVDPRRFTLAPARTRDLAGVTAVQVLYGVIAVFTVVKFNQVLSVVLEAADSSTAAAQMERCEALATGVIELNRQALLDASTATYDDGDYEARVKTNSFKLLEGSRPGSDPGSNTGTNQRRLVYTAEVELKITRALHDDEGRPILRIRTPRRPVDPQRPVDIEVGVDA